jgi:hypothetical protein
MVQRRILDRDRLSARIEVADRRVVDAPRKYEAGFEPVEDAEIGDEPRFVVEDVLVVRDRRWCGGADDRLGRVVRRDRGAADRRQIERETTRVDVPDLGPPDREVRVASARSAAGDRARYSQEHGPYRDEPADRTQSHA